MVAVFIVEAEIVCVCAENGEMAAGLHVGLAKSSFLLYRKASITAGSIGSQDTRFKLKLN